MSQLWDGLSEWWVEQVAVDPSYADVVTPLLVDLLAPTTASQYLDVGCGEGRVMGAVAAVGGVVMGLDLAPDLLGVAAASGPVVRWKLPTLTPLTDASFDGAYVVLVLEHIEDHETLLLELARVVRPEGCLVVVVNHPLFTAPESAPIQDEDGEVLWRPGAYFGSGWTDEPAGEGTIRFHHRPMADLLTAAAAAGWCLQRLVELGPTEAQIARHPALEAQRHIPRLLGARWIKRSW